MDVYGVKRGLARPGRRWPPGSYYLGPMANYLRSYAWPSDVVCEGAMGPEWPRTVRNLRQLLGCQGGAQLGIRVERPGEKTLVFAEVAQVAGGLRCVWVV